ncbi:MAG: flagellar biosynthetic protein FliO [Planctomycetota bacterium]
MACGGAFVLAVGLVVLYLWKRRGLPAGRTAAEVIESRPVDAEMSIHLLKVGDRVFVVASTGEAVQKIGEVEEDELPEPDAGDTTAEESHFRTVLQTVLGRQQ